MEFYHLGKHCSQDLCNQLDFLPYKCSGCQKTFCQDHWKFQDHKCPKEDDFLRNRRVPSCPICQVAIPVAKGEDLNAKVDEHISKNCQRPSKTVDPAYNHLCKAQGCRKKEVIPFQCNQCHLNFCVKHRHARDHNCEPKALSQPTRNSPKKQEPASVLSILSSFGSSLLPSFRNKADLTEDDQVAAAIEESLKTYEAEQSFVSDNRIMDFKKLLRSIEDDKAKLKLRVHSLKEALSEQSQAHINELQVFLSQKFHILFDLLFSYYLKMAEKLQRSIAEKNKEEKYFRELLVITSLFRRILILKLPEDKDLSNIKFCYDLLRIIKQLCFYGNAQKVRIEGLKLLLCWISNYPSSGTQAISPGSEQDDVLVELLLLYESFINFVQFKDDFSYFILTRKGDGMTDTSYDDANAASFDGFGVNREVLAIRDHLIMYEIKARAGLEKVSLESSEEENYEDQLLTRILVPRVDLSSVSTREDVKLALLEIAYSAIKHFGNRNRMYKLFKKVYLDRFFFGVLNSSTECNSMLQSRNRLILNGSCPDEIIDVLLNFFMEYLGCYERNSETDDLDHKSMLLLETLDQALFHSRSVVTKTSALGFLQKILEVETSTSECALLEKLKENLKDLNGIGGEDDFLRLEYGDLMRYLIDMILLSAYCVSERDSEGVGRYLQHCLGALKFIDSKNEDRNETTWYLIHSLQKLRIYLTETKLVSYQEKEPLIEMIFWLMTKSANLHKVNGSWKKFKEGLLLNKNEVAIIDRSLVSQWARTIKYLAQKLLVHLHQNCAGGEVVSVSRRRGGSVQQTVTGLTPSPSSSSIAKRLDTRRLSFMPLQAPNAPLAVASSTNVMMEKSLSFSFEYLDKLGPAEVFSLFKNIQRVMGNIIMEIKNPSLLSESMQFLVDIVDFIMSTSETFYFTMDYRFSASTLAHSFDPWFLLCIKIHFDEKEYVEAVNYALGIVCRLLCMPAVYASSYQQDDAFKVFVSSTIGHIRKAIKSHRDEFIPTIFINTQNLFSVMLNLDKSFLRHIPDLLDDYLNCLEVYGSSLITRFPSNVFYNAVIILNSLSVFGDKLEKRTEIESTRTLDRIASLLFMYFGEITAISSGKVSTISSSFMEQAQSTILMAVSVAVSIRIRKCETSSEPGKELQKQGVSDLLNLVLLSLSCNNLSVVYGCVDCLNLIQSIIYNHRIIVESILMSLIGTISEYLSYESYEDIVFALLLSLLDWLYVYHDTCKSDEESALLTFSDRILTSFDGLLQELRNCNNARIIQLTEYVMLHFTHFTHFTLGTLEENILVFEDEKTGFSINRSKSILTVINGGNVAVIRNCTGKSVYNITMNTDRDDDKLLEEIDGLERPEFSVKIPYNEYFDKINAQHASFDEKDELLRLLDIAFPGQGVLEGLKVEDNVEFSGLLEKLKLYCSLYSSELPEDFDKNMLAELFPLNAQDSTQFIKSQTRSRHTVPKQHIVPAEIHRLFSANLGLLDYDRLNDGNSFVVPLKSSASQFWRDIKGLDKIYGRECIKAACIYVGQEQRDEQTILGNTRDHSLISQDYIDFMNELGWEVELANHEGFLAGLDKSGASGTHSNYYCTRTLEVMFHDASRMPNDPNDPKHLKKKRHIGNDHIHVVWNESEHFKKQYVGGDFGNVVIVICPIKDYGLYLVRVQKDRPSLFGPLLDWSVLTFDLLAPFVRSCCINGYRRYVNYGGSYVYSFQQRLNDMAVITQRHSLFEKNSNFTKDYEALVDIFRGPILQQNLSNLPALKDPLLNES